jgi:uncharacterized protein YcbX
LNARVRQILVAPVKGLRVNVRSEVLLSAHGVRENRRFFLVDGEGRLANGKRLGALQAVTAEYGDTDRTLSLQFPDGKTVSDAIESGPRLAARFYSTTIAAVEVLGPWSTALSQHAGVPLRLVESVSGWGADDRGHDGAVSLISSASIARLARETNADQPIDARRFRMLFEVEGTSEHEEDEWLGRALRIGEAAVRVRGHVGRCAVTKRNPETGVSDLDTLGALASYRRDASTTEPLACGVYGEVLEPGTVRVGDALDLF